MRYYDIIASYFVYHVSYNLIKCCYLQVLVSMLCADWNMVQVGAVDGDEELTPLGYHLAKLPVDVLIGKVCTLRF